MNKNRNKYDAKRAETVKWLAAKYGYTEMYIRSIIRENSTVKSIVADDVRKEYRQKYAALEKVFS